MFLELKLFLIEYVWSEPGRGLGEPEMESESLGGVSEKLDMKGVVVGKVHRSVDGLVGNDCY